MAGSLPDIASLTQYGGPWSNYSPVVDPTTDVPAAGLNQIAESTAQMTHTAIRAWVRMNTAGISAAPSLVAHDSNWGNAPGVAPTLTWQSKGTLQVFWPTTVQDEIPQANDGSVPQHVLNLRSSWSQNVLAGPTFLLLATSLVSANAAQLYVVNTAGALIDTSNVILDVWVF